MGMIEAVKRIIGLEPKPEVPDFYVLRRRPLRERRKLPERRVDRDWGKAAE